MEFEYRIVSMGNYRDQTARQALLNRMGADGWRLVCTDSVGGFVFMREKPAAKTGPSETKEVRDGS